MKNKSKIHLIISQAYIWCALFFAQASLGQNTATPMFFDHLTISEGLSHNTVFCLLQDHYGYIWIGTQNGLHKYDGYSFEVYRSDGNPSGVSGFYGRNILSLFEDSKANLWVGTRKHGINLREASSDQFINLQKDSAFTAIDGFDISSFFEDKSGNIWICTVGAGILKYDRSTGKSHQYNSANSGLSNDLVFEAVQDKYGDIWVSTAGIGINLLGENDRFSVLHVNMPDNPDMNGYRKALFLDDEYLWIGTEGTGLYRLNLKERDFTHFTTGEGSNSISSNIVRDIIRAKDDRIYIATDGGGLNIYDAASDQVHIYMHEAGKFNGLNSNALFCFLEDRTDNIWIGTYNGGVNVQKSTKTWFEFFKPVTGRGDELGHRSILSIYQSEDGTIWVGTDGGGLNWLNQENNRFSFSSFKNDPMNPNSLAGNAVTTIFEDNLNQLWIGSWGAGLDMYDPQSNIFRHYTSEFNNPNSLSSNNVWSIAQRSDNELWIGTIGGGLNMFDLQTQQFKAYRFDPTDATSIAQDNVMIVYIDRDEQIWIGTADNGLDRWDDDKRTFTHYRHNPMDSTSISNDEIRAIFQDRRGDIWIGTEGGGLNQWKDENKFSRIDKNDGLIANSIMGITEDDEGMIWLTTFEGISRLDPSTMTIRNFHHHSGQQSNQFNQKAILTADDGKLFFGGINGLNAIRPEQVKEDTILSSIIFTDLKIFNNSVPSGRLADGQIILHRPIEDAESIELRYKNNSFSIEFSAIDYNQPLEHVYAYQMDGFDPDWQYTLPGRHSASYTNLDPGTYTFRVSHRGNEASIEIVIKPPFWQTYWFKLLLAFLLIGFIVIGVIILLKRKEGIHKQQLFKAQSEILLLRNENLRTEVNAKNSKLMFSAGQMAHKNEILSGIKLELQELEKQPSPKIRRLIHTLDRELKGEDYWKDFNLYFDQVDKHFIQSILKKHPELTQNDLRICSLMRLNLSTKEIASLLNVSVRGVEQSRYRLKKRLNLDGNEDLSRYILNYERED